MIILGIDPGTAIMGYGVIKMEGNSFQVLDYGCLYTEAGVPLEKRLAKLYRGLIDIIERFRPDAMAVEELFFNKNAKTALSVGHARGIVLLAGELYSLKLGEYTPLQVKQAVVGYGRAEKKQIQFMVKTILGMKNIVKPDDAADALAVAICHAHSCQSNILGVE